MLMLLKYLPDLDGFNNSPPSDPPELKCSDTRVILEFFSLPARGDNQGGGIIEAPTMACSN
jgi:hypothetical protein